jgi:hypothetical protein
MVNKDRMIELHYNRDRLITLVAGVGIVLGFVLLVLGINGSVTLQAEAKNLSGKLVNASPGVVMSVVGFVLLGIQAWKRPTSSIRDGETKVELHESGPVFLLPEGVGIRLNRPTDRDERGDHWYGDPIDSIIDKLTRRSLNRDEQSPRTIVSDMESDNLEQTIGSLVDAWVRSAASDGRGDRTVIINIGGDWKGYGFEGGQTYEGKLAKEQLGFVLHFLGVLAQQKGVGPAA